MVGGSWRRIGSRWSGTAARLAALGLALVAACGAPQQRTAGNTTAVPVSSCDLPQTVHLIVQASDRLNPDPAGRSLPTVVRIYQLKGIARLERAEFGDVWQRAAQTLGEDVVGVQELVLEPHTRVVRSFTRNPEAQYVVAVGIFRRPAGVAWWSPFELPPPPAQTRCAAQRQNPTAPPPPAPDPRFVFFLEDYRVEAGDEDSLPDAPLARGAAPPVATDPQAPPGVRGSPGAPSAPNLPSAPSAPAAPSAPSGVPFTKPARAPWSAAAMGPWAPVAYVLRARAPAAEPRAVG